MPNIKNILIIVPVIALFWVWNVYGRTPAAPLTTLAATNLHTLSANLADTKADAAETTSTQSQTTKPVNAIVVTGDPDLKPENIKKDVQLFGVTGTLLDRGTDHGVKTIMPKKEEQPLQEGYYQQGSKVEGDPDLKEENIKAGVSIFDVQGTLEEGGSTYQAGVPKTGQKTKHNDKDDGHLQKGVEWPNPRFTANGDKNNDGDCTDSGETCDGTVTDNLTGLIWLKNANCADAKATWSQAFKWVKELNKKKENNGGKMNGNNCNDTSNNGSHQTDWRLPNVRELQSLVHYGYSKPALSNAAGTGKWAPADPFDNVEFNNWAERYWSSSTFSYGADFAWGVDLSDGYVGNDNKTDGNYVWPVRGGQ